MCGPYVPVNQDGWAISKSVNPQTRRVHRSYIQTCWTVGLSAKVLTYKQEGCIVIISEHVERLVNEQNCLPTDKKGVLE